MKPCVRIVLVSFFFLVLAGAGIMARTLPDTHDMTVVDGEQRDGYKCFLIEYSVVSGCDYQTEDDGNGEEDCRDGILRSYLLVPDSASALDKRPGLVLLHDHGARFDIGKEKLARPMEDTPLHIRRSSEEFVRTNFDGVYFADSLASLGYVVIVPDMLYWGGRSTQACQEWSRLKYGNADEPSVEEHKKKARIDSLKKAVYEGQRTVYDSLAAKGIIWAEKTLEEDACAARILSGLDFVDPEKVAAFGWSMGAHRAWLLAAFSPLVSTGVSLSWMTLKETQAQPYKASDYAMLIPRLRDSHDFPDIALLLAPKPYLFLSGTEDKLFPVHAVERAYARMQSIYSGKGAEGMLRTEFFEGGHHCGKEVQAVVVDFLEKNLTLQ